MEWESQSLSIRRNVSSRNKNSFHSVPLESRFLPWFKHPAQNLIPGRHSAWFCLKEELESSSITELWILSLHHSHTEPPELESKIMLDQRSVLYVEASQIFKDSFCTLLRLNFPRALIIQSFPSILPKLLVPAWVHFGVFLYYISSETAVKQIVTQKDPH